MSISHKKNNVNLFDYLIFWIYRKLNMTGNKGGLTGIHENARGFVGSKPGPHYDFTRNNRPRIRFCIACGENKPELGKYTTWRYCVAYGPVADSLKQLQVGDLVKCYGWIVTEAKRDEYYKPIVDELGNHEKQEFYVLHKAEIMSYQRKPDLQPALAGLINN